jgi:predicted dehydrogenase
LKFSGRARFHPAIQRVKEILDSGELGAIKSIETSLALPKGLMPADDIRFNYELGGGAMMDLGCTFTVLGMLDRTFLSENAQATR